MGSDKLVKLRETSSSDLFQNSRTMFFFCKTWSRWKVIQDWSQAVVTREGREQITYQGFMATSHMLFKSCSSPWRPYMFSLVSYMRLLSTDYKALPVHWFLSKLYLTGIRPTKVASLVFSNGSWNHNTTYVTIYIWSGSQIKERRPRKVLHGRTSGRTWTPSRLPVTQQFSRSISVTSRRPQVIWEIKRSHSFQELQCWISLISLITLAKEWLMVRGDVF